MSLNEAGDKLGWGRGRLNRFEANQWREPDPSHIRDLARIYAATEAEHDDLEALVTRARARLWWHEADKDKNRIFANEFPGFENDAAQISVYMSLVLPGLLQTRPYDTDITEVTRASQVNAYQDTFARIREAALTPAATRAHLAQLRRSCG